MKIKTLLAALLVAALLMSPVALMEELPEIQDVVLEESAQVVEEEVKTEPEPEAAQPDTEEIVPVDEATQPVEAETVEAEQEIASEPVDAVVEEAEDVDLSELPMPEVQSDAELDLVESKELTDYEATIDESSEYSLYEPMLFDASVTITESDFLNAAYANEGGSWSNGMCLAWVKCFWESLGGPSSTDCCARHYFQNRIVSTSRDNIPIGADIYLYDNRSIPKICGTCGGHCGHIGVYVGDGKFMSTLTSNGSTFIRNRSISDWESWGYSFAGWGWHDGIRVSNSGSSYIDNTTTSINKTYRIKSTTTLGLNIRPAASTSNTPLGTLNPGDTIACTKRTNNQVNSYYWLYGTSSTGITGWISENMDWIEEVTSVSTGSTSNSTSTTTGSTSNSTSTSTSTASTSSNTSSQNTTTVKATSMRMKGKVTLGKNYQFDFGANNIKSCKSSKKKVATISSTGLIETRAEGKAKITVQFTNNKKFILQLTVIDKTKPTKITLNKKGVLKWYTQDPLTLTATLSPKTAISDITWKTSNSRIATVNNGVVTFNKTGLVKITAITNKGKKKASVIIKAVNR